MAVQNLEGRYVGILRTNSKPPAERPGLPGARSPTATRQIEDIRNHGSLERPRTASRDGTAQVWNAATGYPITPPLKRDQRVRHVAWSPDGRRILTASDAKTARV